MKRKNLVAALFTLAGFVGLNSVSAQESDSPWSVGADVVSRYVWRGLDYGSSPSIQPGVEFSKGNFGVGAWGAYTTNGTGLQEMDLYAYYNLSEQFTLTLTDYHFPLSGGGAGSLSSQYLDFENSHIYEIMADYNGTEDMPLTVKAAVNVAGADAENSIYTELGYGFKYVSVFAGFGNGFYSGTGLNPGGDFSPVNIGMSTEKEIKVTESFSLPVSASLAVNPHAEHIFLVVGFSL